MQKLDKKFTQQLQNWLNTPAHQRDTVVGATLLLQCSKNRALYNSVLMRPQKYAAKLEYELRKYLRMRLDNMAVADVVRLEAKVIPLAEQTVSRPPVDSSETAQASSSSRGRRDDHDSLPPEIQQLWDSNYERYRNIVHLFNELKALKDAQPCDRYELLKQLADLDSKYRSNLAAYDSWQPGEEMQPEDVTTATTADVIKQVAAARKSISKYRRRLTELDEADTKRAEVLEKLQGAVDIVLGAGVGFTDTVASELREAGINL